MPILPTPKPGILDIAPYVPGKSAAAGAKRIIKLASNENALGPSPKAIAAYKAAAENLQRYPDGNATLLREAIARVHGLPLEQIVCGAGSDELIGLLIHAYAGAGDDVLMSAHGFLMYKIYAQGFGCNVVSAPEQNVTAHVDNLLAALTPKTKIVFIANPNNPTGTYISGAEMARLHAGLPQHVLLVIDDAYAECVTAPDYDDGAKLVAAHGNVVMLRTFSKIYALPALRLGWGYMPAAIADVLNRIRGPFNVNTPAILAGAAAVEDQAHVRTSREFNVQWREWMRGELEALGLHPYPSQANFLLVKFPQGKHSAANANAYLMSEGIIPRETIGYGLPDCLRITIGLETENKALVDALKSFLATAS